MQTIRRVPLAAARPPYHAAVWRATTALAIGLALCPPRGWAQERTSQNDDRLGQWLKRFPQADANQDGILTAPEADAYRRKRLEPGAVGVREALTPTLRDVRYGEHPRQILDLFKADSATPAPVLIFFHGGGFVAGDKRTGAESGLSQQCFAAGIAVVSANYRYVKQGADGAPPKPFPGPMEDGVRVVQFVRAKASEWNLDPERVAVAGGSAGAVISLWIALKDDQADETSADPVARLSSRVSGAVSYSGPTSLDPQVILKHVGGNPQIHPSLLPFYAVASIDELAQPEKLRLVEDASVINHVSAGDPPLYLKHSSSAVGDAPLPPTASPGESIHHAMFGKLLKDRCDALGVRCILSCKDVRADLDELEFLQDVFGLAGHRD